MFVGMENRCWRRIWIGKMYNGHKLVFGLLGKSTHLLVFISWLPAEEKIKSFSCLYLIYC